MKMLMILAAVLGMNTVNAHAYEYVAGDKILFQSVSTYVSAVFSKSLCLNGDTYEALVNECTEWRNRGNDNGPECVAFKKVTAYQPMASTRQRCAEYTGRDQNHCAVWETVDFVQSPVRTVKFYNSNDQLIKTAKVTIPACGPASK